MKIIVLAPAKQEFDEAFVYYEQRQVGLGEELRSAIKAQVAKIKTHPDAWMLIRPGIRKCLGTQFPYDLIYERHASLIVILAVAHKKRRPNYWSARTICD